MSKKVCVVGSGIIGLGSALRFLRSGHRVTIVSSPTYFMPTSLVSAAFWFPYACSLSVEQEIALAEPTYVVEMIRSMMALITVMLTFLCRDRDRPVPVLSNAVPLAFSLRPKASSVPKRP